MNKENHDLWKPNSKFRLNWHSYFDAIAKICKVTPPIQARWMSRKTRQKRRKRWRTATAENFDDMPHEYPVNRIVRPVGKGDSIWYVVHWYSYTSAEDMVEPPEHIFEYLTFLYRGRTRRNDAMRQRRRRAEANIRRKVSEWPAVTCNRNVEDEI